MKTDRQLKMVCNIVYVGELEQDEFTTISNTDVEDYKKRLQNELEDLFLAGDDRAEQLVITKFEMKIS